MRLTRQRYNNFLNIDYICGLMLLKMKYKIYKVLIIIIVAIVFDLCFPACGDVEYDPQLLSVESIMREHPDSAMAVLEAMDPSSFSRDKDFAKYTLLSIRARHNNHLFYADSLMYMAEEWFMKHGSDEEKAQILYCIGNSFSSRDSFSAASGYYSRAVIFAENSGDPFLVAAIHNALGYSCRFQMDYEEALSHFTSSSELIKEIGNMQQYLIPKYQQIGMLNSLNRLDEAEIALKEASDVALSISDTVTIVRLASMEASVRSNNNPDEEQARRIYRDLLETYKRYNRGRIPESHYNTIGALCYQMNDLDSARLFFTASLRSRPPLETRLGVYSVMSSIEEREGNMEEALRYERLLVSLQDTLYNETKEAMIQTAERKYKNEYLQKSYDLLSERFYYQKFFIAVIILVFIGLILFIVRFYMRRLRNQKKNMEEALSYVDSIRDGYSELNERYELLKSDMKNRDAIGGKMVKILGNRMESLKALLEMASIYESRPSLFYAKFKEHIKVSPYTDGKWEKEIIEITNLSCNNLIERLGEDHPDLSLHELCYCSLICLGFSQQSIRTLYDHTNINSIYSLRTKIRAKLGISNSNRSLDNFFKEMLQEENISTPLSK